METKPPGTSYRIRLQTEEEEGGMILRGSYTLSFDTKEEADAAIPLLRTAIKQGARCGKVRVAPNLTFEELERLNAAGLEEEHNARCEALEEAWSKLDLPAYLWLTSIEWYRKVTEEDLTIGGV